MADRTRLTTTETVRENGSWLFTVRDQYGEPDEVIVVPCEDGERANADREDADREDADREDADREDADGRNADGVRAWVNRCTHEAQRLDRGFGAAMRDGEIICPKHGSMFDACSGYCDNGDAADTTLVDVDVAVEGDEVFLTDDAYEFAHEGSIQDGDENGGDDSDEDGGDEGGDEDASDGEDEGDGGTAIDGNTPSWASDDDDDDAPSSTSHIGL